MDLTRNILNNITTSKPTYEAAYLPSNVRNPYEIDDGRGGKEDISWIY
jgi:hypothetical protein